MRRKRRRDRPRRAAHGAFSLIELLIVVTILAILAAALFPVFARSRERARSIRCVANLRQLGQGVMMYAQDYDDRYPYGLDPADKYAPQIWWGFPAFQAQIPQLPMLHEILDPYVRSAEVWYCPSDTGYDYLDDSNIPLDGRPTAFGRFGTSYFYRTEAAVIGLTTTSLNRGAEVSLLMDATGAWHGEDRGRGARLNVLFGDGHVKSATRAQYDEAFQQPLA